MLKEMIKIMAVVVCVTSVSMCCGELLLHLDGSVTGVDPNTYFEDQAKSNDALPQSSTGSEVGVGNVLDVYQTSFGAVGGNAMHFSGSEARAANIPEDSPDFDKSYNQFTVSLWYKPNSVSDDDSWDNYLIGKMGGSGNRGWRLQRVDDDSQVSFMYFDAPNGSNQVYGMFPAGVAGVSPADFKHIAITFEGDTAVKTYADGVRTRTLEALATLNGDNNAPLQIGNSGSYGKRSADGIIDDVGIWDEVISDQRLAVIYALGIFEDVSLSDPLIDEFLMAFDQQQPINIGCNVWEYASGYSTTVGQTGGSVAACNAYVVLDDSGNGMRLTSCGNDIESDLTNDCNVDILDYSVLADQWLSSNLP